MKLVFQKYLGEDSYFLVYLQEDGSYAVYEIPQYGGEERFVEHTNDLVSAIRLGESFT